MKILNFFKAQQSLFPLFLFRISIALLTLVHLFSLKNDYDTLYSQNGFIRAEVNHAIMHERVLTLPRVYEFLTNYIVVSEQHFINYILTAYTILLISLLVGFQTRLVAILCFIIHGALVNSNLILCYGYDNFANNSLLYCILMPVGYYNSVDNYLFKRQNLKNSLIGNISIRVLQIHLCIIYFMSGLNKTFGASWYNGEAIWRAVMQPPLSHIDFSFLATYPFIPIAIGFGTLFIELSYPILIWIKPVNKYFLGMVVLMHIGIAVALQLWFFAGIMILWNLVAYAKFPERVNIKMPKIYSTRRWTWD
ncbi:MAG: hypothetical protein RLZZ628_1263 [Bacteroidota bacterium]|jgi:hypothetical protein